VCRRVPSMNHHSMEVTFIFRRAVITRIVRDTRESNDKRYKRK